MKKLPTNVVSIPYSPPLHWPFLLTFMGFHQLLGIEAVSDTTYQRVFEINHHIGFVHITCDARKSILVTEIFHDDAEAIPVIIQNIRHVFDLDLNVDQLQKIVFQQPILEGLWTASPGLRVARGWNNFEVVINTILGQLISTQQAQKLMAQIAQHCGKPVLHPYYDNTVYLFPDPAILAQVNLDFLKVTKMKKTAIREVSRRIAGGQINLFSQDSDALKNNLLKVPGIGRWSAEYILLRLGHTDAFPQSDLVLSRAIKHFPNLEIDQLKPRRSYVALYLWKYYLELSSNSKTNSF